MEVLERKSAVKLRSQTPLMTSVTLQTHSLDK